MSFIRSSALLVVFLGACHLQGRTGDPLPVTNDAALSAQDTTPLPTIEAGSLPSPSMDAGAQSPPAAEAGAPTLDQTCVRTDLGPVPPPAAPCTATPSACAPPGMSCRSTGLAMTLRSQLKACGSFCGDIAVAFSSGCASDVSFSRSGSLQQEAVQACIRQLILGKAWTCAPADAWAFIYIDNCTLF